MMKPQTFSSLVSLPNYIAKCISWIKHEAQRKRKLSFLSLPTSFLMPSYCTSIWCLKVEFLPQNHEQRCPCIQDSSSTYNKILGLWLHHWVIKPTLEHPVVDLLFIEIINGVCLTAKTTLTNTMPINTWPLYPNITLSYYILPSRY